MSGLLDNEEDVNAQIEAVLSEDQGEYDRLIPDRAILKMLVTDNIAGAIIGKNGKSIAEIQEECGARIKVSQTADFYPGTSERTILITGVYIFHLNQLLLGSGNNVLHAQDIIWQKIAQVLVFLLHHVENCSFIVHMVMVLKVLIRYQGNS